jgi:hypothetical protein
MAKAKSELCESQRIIAYPGLRMAQGLEAFAAGDYANSWVQLREARADLQQIGGSHAQRDVFQRICVEAALRGGYLDQAQGLLEDRSLLRGKTQDGYTARRLALIAQARQQAV